MMKMNDEKLMVNNRDLHLKGDILESDRKRGRNKL